MTGLCFTTGTMARLVGVTPRTVCKWVDLRFMPSHKRHNGVGDRLVSRSDFVRFLREREPSLWASVPHVTRYLCELHLPGDDPRDPGGWK